MALIHPTQHDTAYPPPQPQLYYGATLPPSSHRRVHAQTLWIGSLDTPLVTERLLYEVCIQFGRVKSINMPRDHTTGVYASFAFVEYQSVEECDYAMKIMNNLKLGNKVIKVNRSAKATYTPASAMRNAPGNEMDKAASSAAPGHIEYYAKVFVGNLSNEVDERMLYETFSTFGTVISARVMLDSQTLQSRGYGFVTYEIFQSSDKAIEVMNGQYLGGKAITVNYAFKKVNGVTTNERHGTEEERTLAQRAYEQKQAHLQKIQAQQGNAANTGNINPSAALAPPPLPAGAGVAPPPPQLLYPPPPNIPASLPPTTAPQFYPPTAAGALPPQPPQQFQYPPVQPYPPPAQSMMQPPPPPPQPPMQYPPPS